VTAFLARLAVLSLLSQTLAAQVPPRSLRAVRTVGPILIDGKLDEKTWAEAPVATDFTTQWPDLGRPAAYRTEVKVLYDDRFLYVGARMHNPGGRAEIFNRLHRRDQDSMNDWFGVSIDSLHDRQTAWSFNVNAGGVQRDALQYADTYSDTSWDGVWESEVSVDDTGWTAELKIPLSLLRIRAGDGVQTWGINFSRSDQGRFREKSAWFVPPRGSNGVVSLFPELTGIEGVRPQPRREWIPYLSLQRKVETAQSFDDRKWETRAGLDVHLGLSTFSQLDATLRPDFGQVEVDQAVINLSTFETFFPEKRPFFLEGMELFQFPEAQLFYSRRIGRGVGQVAPGPGETLVDLPMAAEIQGAAKYTSKLEGGLNVGLLAASVAPARATLRDGSGQEVEREVSPLSNYGVLRVQQVLDNRGSYVGGFGTFSRQAGSAGREADVGALDATWKTADRSFTTVITAAHSLAGPKGGRLGGDREVLQLSKQWRNGMYATASGVNASRDFDPNDLGYLRRADERGESLSLGRHHDAYWSVFRNWEWSFSQNLSLDQAGQTTAKGFSGKFQTDTKWFWAIWLNAGVYLPAYDDRELRTFRDPVKKYLLTTRTPWTSFGFDTAGNRPWYLRFNVNRYWQEGGPSTDVTLFHNIKVNAAIELQVESTSTHTEGERKYVTTPIGSLPVTGLRTYTAFNQTIRASYAFTPRFTIQTFVQWLAGNWAYRDYRAYVNDDRLQPVAPLPNQAASNRVWNVNLITRWEFQPGSTFFLVYTHGANTAALVNDRGSLSPRRDLSLLGSTKADDTLQVKVSYLFR
jgi:hypothetical protein